MPPNIPVATYRLQFTKDFTFSDAAAIAPYLKQLGISHVYASPFLKARSGSTHGYDIVDHNMLNPELGGETGFELFSDALARLDLGLILDFVPNHMGVGLSDNAWWLDVLEFGPKSSFARYFDIAWESLPFRHGGGMLLPILGRSYGDALEAGEIELRYDAAEGSFSAWYFDHRLPINPSRYREILRTITLGDGSPVGRQVAALAQGRRGADVNQQTDSDIKKALAGFPEAADFIARGLAAYDATQGVAAVQALHRLLERQYYRLAHWRVAINEINYRRFFDVNDLAGLRMEEMRVFSATHRLVIRLIQAGRLHGLRLDHIDGLQNPAQYTDRLQRLIRRTRKPSERRAKFYLLIEKILGEGEPLPVLPGVDGTTGYEWLNEITRVLIDTRGIPQLIETAQKATGEELLPAEVLRDAKSVIIDSVLASEFTVLARMLARIAAGHWRTRDFTEDRLKTALRLFVLSFPIYRTYVTAEQTSARDRAIITEVIAAARRAWDGPDEHIFDLLADALTLDLIGPDRTGYSRARVIQFATKVQQFTGPLMAKSLEDTSFYRYLPLLALNEVGGSPETAHISPENFHRALGERAHKAPYGLTASATHDTKRGEDTRARLAALSEMAAEWSTLSTRWRERNAPHVHDVNGRRAPSRLHEYLLYQTLVGAWPLDQNRDKFRERISAYMIKAAREGKQDTSWINPDSEYESRLTEFVTTLFDRRRSPSFLDEVEAFANRLSLLGALNSLSQLTLKTMMPGVPDFYQGTEFWDLSLVDPDNRRPVDFAARKQVLDEIERNSGRSPADCRDGALKLRVTRILLKLRNAEAELFRRGAYRPLDVTGAHAEHILAFERSLGRRSVIVIVGRHFAPFTDQGRRWFDASGIDAMLQLPRGRTMKNILAEDSAREQDIRGEFHARELADLPCAVLI